MYLILSPDFQQLWSYYLKTNNLICLQQLHKSPLYIKTSSYSYIQLAAIIRYSPLSSWQLLYSVVARDLNKIREFSCTQDVNALVYSSIYRNMHACVTVLLVSKHVMRPYVYSRRYVTIHKFTDIIACIDSTAKNSEMLYHKRYPYQFTIHYVCIALKIKNWQII